MMNPICRLILLGAFVVFMCLGVLVGCSITNANPHAPQAYAQNTEDDPFEFDDNTFALWSHPAEAFQKVGIPDTFVGNAVVISDRFAITAAGGVLGSEALSQYLYLTSTNSIASHKRRVRTVYIPKNYGVVPQRNGNGNGTPHVRRMPTLAENNVALLHLERAVSRPKINAPFIAPMDFEMGEVEGMTSVVGPMDTNFKIEIWLRLTRIHEGLVIGTYAKDMLENNGQFEWELARNDNGGPLYVPDIQRNRLWNLIGVFGATFRNENQWRCQFKAHRFSAREVPLSPIPELAFVPLYPNRNFLNCAAKNALNTQPNQSSTTNFDYTVDNADSSCEPTLVL